MKQALKLNAAIAVGVCLLTAGALADRKYGKSAEKTVIPTAEASRGNDRLIWVYSKPAGFEFARIEVTVAQFEKCVSAGACHTKNRKTKNDIKWCNWGYSDRSDHPMNCVDWYGARDFCEWVGGRLPTEDEWYKEASNGGSRDYPWGGEKANCSRAVMDEGGKACGNDRTWPVCSKPAGNSVSGLCDMSGSVWEWTSSGSDSSRVLRGGGWSNDNHRTLRAAGRSSGPPTLWSSYLGFRCVRDPSGGGRR